MTFSLSCIRLIVIMLKKVLLFLFLIILSLPLQSAIVGESATVRIVLTLQREPKYEVGLTFKPIDEDTEISTITDISMKEINSQLVLNKEYYLSYRFYEFNSVSLTMSLSGDLKYTGKTSNWDSTELIPYTLTLSKTDGTLVKQFNSSDTEEIVILNTKDLDDKNVVNGQAMLIGQTVEDSYKISLYSSTDSSQYRMGEYKASIILKLINN